MALHSHICPLECSFLKMGKKPNSWMVYAEKNPISETIGEPQVTIGFNTQMA